MFPFARIAVVPFLVVALQPTLSAAFSWQLTTPPKQCSNLSISIVGSDGKPPYHVLIIPFGVSPLPNNVDPRAVIDQPFDGHASVVNFAINYPANSSFVAVVSDANGFGTGGASVATQVGNSNDASCFDPTTPWTPLFYYGIGSDNQLTQCQSTRIWWNGANAPASASFVGVVPGGQCFGVDETNVTTIQDQGTGFNWTPDVQAGTTVMVVGGDSRGMGTAGSGQFTVHSSNDSSCLSGQSPTSTSGTAAGSVQTGAVASANSSSGDGSGGPNVGTIVGAAVGGIIGLMALITFIVLSYFCLRQDGSSPRRLKKHLRAAPSTGQMSSTASRPLSGHTGQGTSIATAPNTPLAHYQPEPLPYTGVGTYNNRPAYTGVNTYNNSQPAYPGNYNNTYTGNYGNNSGPAYTGTYNNNAPAYTGNYGNNNAPAYTGTYSNNNGPANTDAYNNGYIGGAATDVASTVPPRSRLDSITSGTGAGMSDTSSYIYRSSPSQGPKPALHQPSILSGVTSRSGGGGGLQDAASQRNSGYGTPSVISSTSGRAYPKVGTSAFSYENTVPRTPPPFYSSHNVKNPPTGDKKYKVTNLE